MRDTGFLTENLIRAYPFIENHDKEIPDWLIVDFRAVFTSGQYDPTKHKVFLAWVALYQNRLRFGFRTDVPGLEDEELVFERLLLDPRYKTEFVQSQPLLLEEDQKCGCIDELLCDPNFTNDDPEVCGPELLCNEELGDNCGDDLLCKDVDCVPCEQDEVSLEISWAILQNTAKLATTSDSTVRVEFENSENCGGTAGEPQRAEIVGELTLTDPAVISLSLDGLRERQSTFDQFWITINDLAFIGAVGSEGPTDCSMVTPAWDTDTPRVVLGAGTHTIKIVADTVDERFHVDAFYEVSFSAKQMTDELECCSGQLLDNLTLSDSTWSFDVLTDNLERLEYMCVGDNDVAIRGTCVDRCGNKHLIVLGSPTFDGYHSWILLQEGAIPSDTYEFEDPTCIPPTREPTTTTTPIITTTTTSTTTEEPSCEPGYAWMIRLPLAESNTAPEGSLHVASATSEGLAAYEYHVLCSETRPTAIGAVEWYSVEILEMAAYHGDVISAWVAEPQCCDGLNSEVGFPSTTTAAE